MRRSSHKKPVGGVESCALYPADAVVTALFSSEGCEVELEGEPIEIPLLDDSSRYEESVECKYGVAKISHSLHLVAMRGDAEEWLAQEFLNRVTLEGVVAVVSLCDGRHLLVGYSSHFGNEQPLRLEALISSSGNNLHDTPTATLRLVSHDTEFSQEII